MLLRSAAGTSYIKYFLFVRSVLATCKGNGRTCRTPSAFDVVMVQKYSRIWLNAKQGGQRTSAAVLVTENDNLCMDGHLVPEFFLIGAMKTSTTTLAYNLFTSPDVYVSRNANSGKELHFFDKNVTFNNKSSWLNSYPRCSFTRRAVATDCTPKYIRQEGTAKRIADFYGALKSKVTFVLLLRNPLERAQSAFYHHVAHAGRIPSTLTFSKFVSMYLRTGFDTYETMWGSQYPPQLETYFAEFDSSQFWIAPYRCNFEPHLCGMTTSFTETLWNHLNVAPGEYNATLHEQSHPHPSIEDDLDSNTLKAIMDKFASIAPSMAKLLAGSDAKLFGYTGKAGDENAVERWLTNGW